MAPATPHWQNLQTNGSLVIGRWISKKTFQKVATQRAIQFPSPQFASAVDLDICLFLLKPQIKESGSPSPFL